MDYAILFEITISIGPYHNCRNSINRIRTCVYLPYETRGLTIKGGEIPLI